MHILNDKMTTKNEEPQTLSLQQSQISIAAKMMADTFFPDPLSCYLLPNERFRLESLEKAWRKTINQDFPLGHVYKFIFRANCVVALICNIRLEASLYL